MSTEFFNDQWRLPNNENKDKVSNYSLTGSGTVGISQPAEVGITSSYSFWMNRNSATTNTAYFYNVVGTAAYGMFFLNSSLIYIRYGDGGQGKYVILQSSELTDAILEINVWQNWTVTRKEVSATAQDIKLYVDGVKVVEVLNTTGAGALGSSVKQVFGAGSIIKMDSFSVFDYELTQAQVTTLYGSSSTGIGNPMSLSPKPVAYYQLGDQSVYNGANYLVPNNSLQDYVFNFNGTSSKVDIASTSLGTSNTISLWFYRPSSGNNSGTFIGGSTTTNPGLNNGRAIYMSGNDIYFSFDAAAFVWVNPWTATGNIRSDNWNHIAIVRDASKADADKIQLSINNSTLISYNVIYFGTPNFSTQTNIANSIGQSFSGAFPFEGFISNISTFTTAFTQAQVSTLYNNGAPSDISSLSPNNWWKLNAADTFNGTNWTINDYGSGSNNGTSAGMTSANLVQSDLQQTSGYSPYALDFDGTDDYISASNSTAYSSYSVSCWVNADTLTNFTRLVSLDSVNFRFLGLHGDGTLISGYKDGSWSELFTTLTITTGTWNHIVLVDNGTNTKIYVNAVGNTLSNSIAVDGPNYYIGSYQGTGNFFNGKLSNVSVWNTDLTSAQVTEIYNEGVPSNLNNHSAYSNLVSWWQLGSNSSFNTNWTCLDEIGTNNAVSAGGMTNDAITNGPGYSANGLGTSSIDIVGDAPYSTANGLSENMDVLDRTTDVPS